MCLGLKKTKKKDAHPIAGRMTHGSLELYDLCRAIAEVFINLFYRMSSTIFFSLLMNSIKLGTSE